MLRFRQPTENRAWSRDYCVTFAFLALLWATEHFVLQASVFDARPVTTHPGTYQMVRFALNLMTATALLLLFSRPFLLLLVVVDFLISLVVVAYNHYFHHALSVYYGVKTLREGLRVAGVVLEIVPPVAWALLCLALVLKLVLIIQITPQPDRLRKRIALLCAAGIVTCLCGLQFTSFYFRNIPITRVTRAVYAYGYLNSWIAEFFVSPDTRQVTQELIELQRDTRDRLFATEPVWPFTTNVVVVQMESIGWSAINYSINGQEVSPYMNKIARTGRIFKVQVYHAIGSEDMDYAVLSGGRPSQRMASYLAPDIPYDNALPRFMQQHGFETLSLHGANGDFFNRRSNFDRMGFNDIWFQEEFNSRLIRQGQSVKESYWGARDEELFRLSTEKMRKATRPQFHFIITLDSHTPFDLITDSEKEIFPGSHSLAQNYFNSVRWLDHLLQNYIQSLPAGTLVIMYGDHPSGVDYQDFHSARNGLLEYVPCIVHVCGASIPVPENSPTPAALPEDLRIHDVINCLRHQIAARENNTTMSNVVNHAGSF